MALARITTGVHKDNSGREMRENEVRGYPNDEGFIKPSSTEKLEQDGETGDFKFGNMP